MARNHNPTTILKRFEKAEEGLKKELPVGVEKIYLKGAMQPVEVVLKRIGEFIQDYKAPEDLREALENAILKRRKSQPEVLLYLDEVRAGVTPLFGASNLTLGRFGFPPRKKPKEMTGKQKVARAEKAKKTRELLHTMGKRQKKNLKAANPQPAPPTAKGKKK